MGEYHYTEERQKSEDQTARGIVAAELKRIGWTAEDLKHRRKRDAKKVRIAQRLRAETAMTLKWIAEELQMGAWTHVSNLLSRQRRERMAVGSTQTAFRPVGSVIVRAHPSF